VLESVAADARDDTIMATLAALRSQGIALDLDDFGVGQASLLSIRRFGVRRIKIDRSFVIGIDRDPEQQAMVGGIVSLGRSMGLEALAEGVETPEQEAALTGLGCSHVQGFGIGKPMPLTTPRLARSPQLPMGHRERCGRRIHSPSERRIGFSQAAGRLFVSIRGPCLSRAAPKRPLTFAPPFC
jgi:EAL domain-containing protein (putative c-di-GMP-specific phosphodiesterase class I)